MKCPYCSGESQVIDSRATADGVRRRRECPDCKRRFTTYERLGEPALKVVKRGGRTEPFQAAKLMRTIGRVCQGRPGIGDEDIERLARSIEAQLVDEHARSVTSARLAELILERLRAVDKLAYDRFAVNYMSEDGQLRIQGSSPARADDGQLGLFSSDGDDDE